MKIYANLSPRSPRTAEFARVTYGRVTGRCHDAKEIGENISI
jgi:hypothetical protein